VYEDGAYGAALSPCGADGVEVSVCPGGGLSEGSCLVEKAPIIPQADISRVKTIIPNNAVIFFMPSFLSI